MATTKPVTFRPGQKVHYTGRDGLHYEGKVVGQQDGPTGTFLQVNIGDAKKPVMKKIRPSQATKV